MTGPTDVFAAAARLYRDGVPFVLATVVRAERPTSARPGAKAIVTGDGRFRGFVGGTCVKPAVRRESLRALADGAPRLLRISPDSPPEGVEAEEGVLEEHMACVSGGALDIHLEPYLPSRRLLLAGSSPIVESLAALGEALGMEVRTAETEEDLDSAAEGAFCVVAGHGEGEWEALKAALTGGRARYVGLVASPRRSAAVRERLVGMGVSEADVGRLRSPAGLDIGAETPGRDRAQHPRPDRGGAAGAGARFGGARSGAHGRNRAGRPSGRPGGGSDLRDDRLPGLAAPGGIGRRDLLVLLRRLRGDVRYRRESRRYRLNRAPTGRRRPAGGPKR